MKPTWRPVWQHIAAAHFIVLGLAVIGIPPPVSALINWIFWLGREFMQAVWRGKSLDPREWTRRTKHEWIMPSIVGVSMALGAAMPDILDLMVVVR